MCVHGDRKEYTEAYHQNLLSYIIIAKLKHYKKIIELHSIVANNAYRST